MTMNRKWSIGVLAATAGVMIGCSTSPSTLTLPPTDQTNAVTTAQTGAVDEATAPSQLAVTDDSITPAEETLQGAEGYNLQQYGYIFSGRRCRWFWVPSNWGYGWGYGRYSQYWNSGRWVLVCNRRNIPYWWYSGPYASYGRGYGRYGYDRTPPRFRPRFDRDRFDNDGRRRGGGRMDRDDDNRGGGGGGRMGRGDDNDGGGRRRGPRGGRD